MAEGPVCILCGGSVGAGGGGGLDGFQLTPQAEMKPSSRNYDFRSNYCCHEVEEDETELTDVELDALILNAAREISSLQSVTGRPEADTQPVSSCEWQGKVNRMECGEECKSCTHEHWLHRECLQIIRETVDCSAFPCPDCGTSFFLPSRPCSSLTPALSHPAFGEDELSMLVTGTASLQAQGTHTHTSPTDLTLDAPHYGDISRNNSHDNNCTNNNSCCKTHSFNNNNEIDSSSRSTATADWNNNWLVDPVDQEDATEFYLKLLEEFQSLRSEVKSCEDAVMSTLQTCLQANSSPSSAQSSPPPPPPEFLPTVQRTYESIVEDFLGIQEAIKNYAKDYNVSAVTSVTR